MSYDPNPKQSPKDTTPTPTYPSPPPAKKLIRRRPDEIPGKDQWKTDPITGKRTKRYPGMEGFLPQYVTPQLNNDAWGGWSNTYGNHPSPIPVPIGQAPVTQGQGNETYGNNPISTAPIPAASNPAGLTQPSIVPAASLGGPSSQMSTPYTPLKFTSPFSVGRNVPGPNGGSFRHRIPNSGFSGSFSNPGSSPNQVSSQAMLIRRGR